MFTPRTTPDPHAPWRPSKASILVGLSIGLGAFVGITVVLFFISARFQSATSDSATIVLEGFAIQSGHILLRDWSLTFDPLWTSNALVDAIAILIGGLRSSLLYWGPAVTAALAVLGGALIAADQPRRSSRLIGGISVIALLCFASPTMEYFFVAHGFHVSTVAYALLAFYAIRRGTFGWRWIFAVALLALGVLGDLLMVAYGVAPLFLAGLLTMLQERRWRAGFSECSAAVVGTVVAEVARAAFNAIGSYRAQREVSVARWHQVFSNLGHAPGYFASLLGLTTTVLDSGAVPSPLRSMQTIRSAAVIAALIVLICVVFAAINVVRSSVSGRPSEYSRLDNCLVLAIICSVAPFAYLSAPSQAGIRYLTATALFSIVLAGRFIARIAARIPRGLPQRVFAGAAIALTLVLAASFASAMASPAMTNPAVALSSWLQSHHLSRGIGGYWTASITTVESGGAVVVRPVLTAANGRVQRMVNLSSASWYRNQPFQFLVYNGTSGMGLQAAVTTWGTPSRSYDVGTYHVLVWNHPLTINPNPPSS